MTPSTEALRKLPLVVILGATATGKSKLAVSLAGKFGGEVVSADSMQDNARFEQIYKGLEILTNKMTEAEMQGIPHHMMSLIDTGQSYDVTFFQKQAIPIVERILQNGKIPIIVGGTNYYIESLLWQVLVTEGKRRDISPSGDARMNSLPRHGSPSTDNCNLNFQQVLDLLELNEGYVDYEEFEGCPSTVLHSALEQCDPARAMTLHPNDRRKILRSLHIYYRTGKKHSSIISEQRKFVTPCEEDVTINHLGGPLRFQNSICFWIQADKLLLKERIDQRVNEMVKRGLRNELDCYMETVKDTDVDFTRGLAQSIGFKEFKRYLQLSSAEKRAPVGQDRFEEGISLLKIATQQYARRQLKWITHRFLKPSKRQLPPIYSLDGNLTDDDAWYNNVTLPAVTILQNYFDGTTDQSLFLEKLVPTIDADPSEDKVVRYCEVCDNRAFVGRLQWDIHLAGNRHRKMRKLKSNGTNLPTKGCSSPPVVHAVEGPS